MGVSGPRWRDTSGCGDALRRPIVLCFHFLQKRQRMGAFSLHINISGLRRPVDGLGQRGGGGVRAQRLQGYRPQESGQAKEEHMAYLLNLKRSQELAGCRELFLP